MICCFMEKNKKSNLKCDWLLRFCGCFYPFLSSKYSLFDCVSVSFSCMKVELVDTVGSVDSVVSSGLNFCARFLA